MTESNKAEIDIAEIRGILKGVDNKLDTMQKDIIHIKNNDKEKLQRIAKIETEQKLLEKWENEHIEINKDTKKEFNRIDQKLNRYISSENKWRVGIIITLTLALFDLVTRFLIK
ncbi:hypothetical protein MBBAR_6c01320 [Methanobrevibacter arboriphilus JCM 13429 = DSM 1125]|uniref:Uncharacterized protein n=1 Tax=Methanobrevibacter arboriphilus JCM 13429 = DSM 1125 TaxID=1300164 RepID=A0A1V6N343_METAZ|nr:hypothetical protein [Methanobrevibacter arboriphilus]OQD59022.1 hypothetical protein MBBAR_6c01320 [Methanobrevibacter arboriphilus JCM 13429 = DSM 1125]